MPAVSLSDETIRKLEKLKKRGEPIEDVIERLIESYEELQDYIEERWEKVQRDRDKFISIDDYVASRGL